MCSVFKKCFNTRTAPVEEDHRKSAVSTKSYTKTELAAPDQIFQTKPDLLSTSIKMAPKNIVVFLSSVRPHRFADRVLALAKNVIEARGMKVTVFDPLEMQFEMLKTPLHFFPNPADAPAWLQEANQVIVDADGFVIISAEYNCSIPPALANMLDHFPPGSFRHRPCGLISYSMGPFGGVRAMTLLRAYSAEFGMLPLPQNVPIPTVQQTLDADGKDNDGRVAKNVEKLAGELEWYADAIANHKKIVKPSVHEFH